MNEKTVLVKTSSPSSDSSSATTERQFLLDSTLGEVRATYNRKGFHGRAKRAKFYFAGTVCAVGHFARAAHHLLGFAARESVVERVGQDQAHRRVERRVRLVERPATLRQNSSHLPATRTLWIGRPRASSHSS